MKTASRRDPAFLNYYADVLEREAKSRPGQNVAWMLAGAARARQEAIEAAAPDQMDLFAA